jgi:hypothetical protein
MNSISDRLDDALKALEDQGLSPVTIVLPEADHQALAEVGEWPVTTTGRGELRYRSISVFKAVRESEGASIVGRSVNGSTRRIAIDERPG